MKRNLVLAIDFDGTIVNDQYPNVGSLLPYAKDVINELYYNNCDIIIWTCRSNDHLKICKDFLDENQIKYTAINSNTPSVLTAWNNDDCRKVFADFYIDDRGLYTPNPIDWLNIRDKILTFKFNYNFYFN